MSRFTDHLGLTSLDYSDGRPVVRDGLPLWYLSRPLFWEEGAVGSGNLITVPAFDPTGLSDAELARIDRRGVTDLGSIPPIARGLVNPAGPEAKAYVLHDDGYVTDGWGGRYGRSGVDGLLLEAMTALGSPAWKRFLVYRAVEWFGGSGWGR